MIRLLCLYQIILLCIGCGSPNTPTLEEKIGQMIMIGFHGTVEKDDRILLLKDQIATGQIGGVVLYRHNIQSPEQLLSLTTTIQKSAPTNLTLLVAVDQEGGKVLRLSKEKGFSGFLSAATVARNYSVEKAETYYQAMAEELSYYGFNMNLGPVVDLNINPNSPVVGKLDRSFSNDTNVVTNYAGAFINAHEKYGVLTACKHFPGHGSATTDTHLEITDVTKTWSDLELDPYRRLNERKLLRSVMTSHVFNAKFDDRWPVTLSTNFLTHILRADIAFDGVIITDDLNMKAIHQYGDFETIVVQAIHAGNDILLFSNFHQEDMDLAIKVRDIVLKHIKEGDLALSQRVEESYNRIIKLKKVLASPNSHFHKEL
jgi:beta-N-acetylhexosaminidase